MCSVLLAPISQFLSFILTHSILQIVSFFSLNFFPPNFIRPSFHLLVHPPVTHWWGFSACYSTPTPLTSHAHQVLRGLLSKPSCREPQCGQEQWPSTPQKRTSALHVSTCSIQLSECVCGCVCVFTHGSSMYVYCPSGVRSCLYERLYASMVSISSRICCFSLVLNSCGFTWKKTLDLRLTAVTQNFHWLYMQRI